ncbi:MAG TPA: energy transducer TonB [Candidatus Binatia bacterium]|nr:energy transducer TonB [Candidatus Binatia bacterium]
MAASQSNPAGNLWRRRGLRYRLQAAVDVTVLRSGIPDTLPGRALNLGEGGVGAVLAGELLPGESVGVEINLPRSKETWHGRAVVRYHDKLRAGLEFMGMSEAQMAAIRAWTGGAVKEAQAATGVKSSEEFLRGAGAGRRGSPRRPRKGLRKLALIALICGAFLLGTFLWRWRRGWQDLESQLPQASANQQLPEIQVPADVMATLLTHRVDPEYPAEARPQNLQGVIVLDVVVGRDGSVVAVHALGGQQILARAAENALRWWRFEPYRVNGRPVAVETKVAVEFKP